MSFRSHCAINDGEPFLAQMQQNLYDTTTTMFYSEYRVLILECSVHHKMFKDFFLNFGIIHKTLFQQSSGSSTCFLVNCTRKATYFLDRSGFLLAALSLMCIVLLMVDSLTLTSVEVTFSCLQVLKSSEIDILHAMITLLCSFNKIA